MIKRIFNKIRNLIWQNNRKKINNINREKLSDKAKSASIISINCMGGILYHDLGLQFLSPTINLFFKAEDYIKFCENLEYYLSIDEFKECKDEDRIYPVAYLGDLKLFLVHYNSIREAQDIWNKRKERINYENLVLIANDREGMNDELKDRFEALPYKKVMFTHIEDKQHKSCFYIKGYEQEESVGIITLGYGYKGFRPIDQFDYIEFLNK